MRKIIVAVFALMFAAFGIVPMTANAAPGKVVTNGMKIVFAPDAAAPYCTLGVVGYDALGRKTGITAGHCVAAPAGWPGRELTDAESALAPVWDANDIANGPIGHIKFISADTSLSSTKDYMVIKIAGDAVLSSNGPALRVDGLHYNLPSAGFMGFGGANVCKDGQTSGKTCGVVTDTTQGLIRSYAFNTQGDSGGPLVIAYNNGDATDWIGIVTRVSASFPPFIYTSAKNILDDLNPRGIYGSGFTVANT